MRQSVKSHKMFSVVSGLTYKNKGMWYKQSSPGNGTPTGYPITNCQFRKHIQIGNIIKTEQVVLMYLGTHTHTHVCNNN